MLKPTECRLGNIVSFEGQNYELYCINEERPQLNTDEFGYNVVTWDKIEGVPITEEWLLANGFETDDNMRFQTIYQNTLKDIKVIFDRMKNKLFASMPFADYKDILFIHQLQNYYFYNSENYQELC